MKQRLKHSRRVEQGCSECHSKLRADGYCSVCDEWDVCARCDWPAWDASPLCEDCTHEELYGNTEDEVFSE